MKKLTVVALFITLTLQSCYDYSFKETHVVKNIYLTHSEGQSKDDYYSLDRKESETGYSGIISDNVVDIYCDSLNIFAKAINFKNDTDFYTLNVEKLHNLSTSNVASTSKEKFYKKLKACTACKKIKIEY
ncbi:MAG: hypothetical protein ABIN91_05840 [Mucilaginibacter sp.]|uniref:hypothetical protein n=1 Tax=Mucilaginibacter sp. TaxID=1882438 RepID=UPI00326741A8